MQPVIATHGLKRSFGSKVAVDGINLLVPSGAIYGFLGPNGAGKTTTIRMLLGLAAPDMGSIAVLGLPMPQQRATILRRVGAMVETPTHYEHLTGRENLDITRRLLGFHSREIDRVLAIVELENASREKVAGFSLGMRQRLGIARALLGRPQLLILDEPTNGLDPDGIRDVRTLLRTLPAREGCTVMLSSHLLAEVEQIATHIGMMWRGRLIAQGPLREVIGARAGPVELDVDRPMEAIRLLSARGLSVFTPQSHRIEVRGEANSADINALLTGAGIAVSRLAPRAATLEDLYVGLTRHETLMEACR